MNDGCLYGSLVMYSFGFPLDYSHRQLSSGRAHEKSLSMPDWMADPDKSPARAQACRMMQEETLAGLVIY